MRIRWAHHTAAATVVRVLACVCLTTIKPLAVAILHSRVAHWCALAVAASGSAVRIGWALGFASATVVRVRSYISLATI